MKRFNKMTACGAVILGLLTTGQAGSQILGGYDPHGWSRESNERGLEQACRAFKNQYRTIVNLHNASRSQRDRENYREHLQEIREKIEQYCR